MDNIFESGNIVWVVREGSLVSGTIRSIMFSGNGVLYNVWITAFDTELEHVPQDEVYDDINLALFAFNNLYKEKVWKSIITKVKSFFQRKHG